MKKIMTIHLRQCNNDVIKYYHKRWKNKGFGDFEKLTNFSNDEHDIRSQIIPAWRKLFLAKNHSKLPIADKKFIL